MCQKARRPRDRRNIEYNSKVCFCTHLPQIGSEQRHCLNIRIGVHLFVFSHATTVKIKRRLLSIYGGRRPQLHLWRKFITEILFRQMFRN
jgi:hypothetical protein